MQRFQRERQTSGPDGQALALAAAFVGLVSLLGACSATPISIPNGADGGLPSRDMGVASDAGASDLSRPDLGPTPNQDAAPQPDAIGDALGDGVGDQATEGGGGDGAVDGVDALGGDSDADPTDATLSTGD